MIGVGPTIAVFSVVEAVLLRPLPYPEGHRILALGEVDDDGSVSNTGFTTAWDWRERTASFSELSIIRASSGTLTGAGDPEPIAGLRVSWNYFDLIGVQPALGRDFLPEEDRAGAPRVIVLSHGLWERRFGSDRTIVGEAITLGGNDYTVVGIMPAGYEDVPSAGEPLHDVVVGPVRTPLRILLGAVGFVLLIACANVGLLYGVEPTDALTLAAVACLMLGVALMASWPPARRAMRLDASTTLASESSRPG